MKIEEPTQSEIEFYSQFKSYRLVNGHNGMQYISISGADTKSVLSHSDIQRRYIQFCDRSLEKGDLIGLSFAEFIDIINSECTYCGEIGNGSVDRIDSGKGYTIDNSQPCCKTCNMMKYTLSDLAFKEQINKIAKNLSTRKK